MLLREAFEMNENAIVKALQSLQKRHSDNDKVHFTARSVHGETIPGDHSLSTVKKHLEKLHSVGKATKIDQGAGRARYVGYRLKD